MEMYGYQFVREEDLKHYGLKGMHWGTRRWQNEDGTFNEAGYQRYFGRGTGEDYHPVKKGSTRGMPSGSGGQKKSFDKEKAKKIAKGVAIGAAVVGGTILVAYGAKHMKDNDILGKIREGRLENARLNEQYKNDKLQIKLSGKLEREKMKLSGKLEMEKINEGFKLDLKGIQADPSGRVNKDVLRRELIKSQGNASGLRKVLSEFNDSDIERLNAGKATLADLRLEHHPWSENQEKYKDYFGEAASKAAKATGDAAKKAYSAVTSDQAKETYKKIGETAGKAAKATGNAAKTAYKAATSDQAKATYKKIGETAGKAAKTAYKTATSDQAKANYKKAAKATGEAIKTAGHIAKSSVEITKLAAQHPQETRAAMDYTTQLLKNLGDLSATNSRNSRTVSGSNASSNYTKKQAVKEYKHQHPNTKLSDSEIASNFGF